MKKLTFVTILLQLSLAAFAQRSYIQSLKNVAEITLPDTGKVIQTPYSVDCRVHSKGIGYQAWYTKVSPKFPGGYAKHLTDTIYAHFIKSTLKHNATLFYKNGIKWNNLRGVYFAYKRVSDTASWYSYCHCFYFNRGVLATYTISRDSLSLDDPKITGFFNTLKLTIRPEQLHQDNLSNDAFVRRTVLIGVLVFLCVLMIIFIISKITSKN